MPGVEAPITTRGDGAPIRTLQHFSHPRMPSFSRSPLSGLEPRKTHLAYWGRKRVLEQVEDSGSASVVSQLEAWRGQRSGRIVGAQGRV